MTGLRPVIVVFAQFLRKLFYLGQKINGSIAKVYDFLIFLTALKLKQEEAPNVPKNKKEKRT